MTCRRLLRFRGPGTWWTERKQKLKESECVICLDMPMSTVLQPCGHMQAEMCSRCCREPLALAESKSVQPQVRGILLLMRAVIAGSQLDP